jgi:isocitrate dehydrogenase
MEKSKINEYFSYNQTENQIFYNVTKMYNSTYQIITCPLEFLIFIIQNINGKVISTKIKCSQYNQNFEF